MPLNRYRLCYLALVLSACSGSGHEGAVLPPAEAASARDSSLSTPTLDAVRRKQ